MLVRKDRRHRRGRPLRLVFPRAKLGYYLFFRWIRIPAYLFALFWFVTQVLGAKSQVAGQSNVSYLAHLGGVAVGILFWIVWTFGDKNRRRAASGEKGS